MRNGEKNENRKPIPFNMKDRQQREQGAHAHRWQLLRGHTSEIENQRESAPPVMWCRHMRSCHSGHARLYTDPPIFGFRFSVFAISIPRLRTHAGAVASSRLMRRDFYSICFSSALHTTARPGPRPRQRVWSAVNMGNRATFKARLERCLGV